MKVKAADSERWPLGADDSIDTDAGASPRVHRLAQAKRSDHKRENKESGSQDPHPFHDRWFVC